MTASRQILASLAVIVFAELARLLEGSAFFAGDEVSLADLLVAPHLDTLA